MKSLHLGLIFAFCLGCTHAFAQTAPATGGLGNQARIGIELGSITAGFLLVGLYAGYDPPAADPWEIDPVLFFGAAPVGATVGALISGALLAPPGRVLSAVGGALLGGLFSIGLTVVALIMGDLNFVSLLAASLLSIPITLISVEFFRTLGPATARGDTTGALTVSLASFRF